MLMGFFMRFIISFLIICSWLREIKAMDNSTLGLLDDMLQEYAHNSLPRRPQTGVLYNASLPSNFTGIEVSIVRLRRDSFWGRGANYSVFQMPPKIFSHPYFTRLDLVYSNLGNQSSYYYNYNVPNYTLVAPVVGFSAYGSRNSTGQIGNLTTLVNKLNFSLFGGLILVHFPNISLSVSQKEKAKCAIFYANGTFEMTNMTLEDMCAVRDQGHFSIVVQAQSSVKQIKKRGRNKLWKWWVFGFGVGVLGLLLFGLVLFMLIRTFRIKKIRKMEKKAERNEVLDAVNVGQSKMPLATVVRTQPVIENNYVP